MLNRRKDLGNKPGWSRIGNHSDELRITPKEPNETPIIKGPVIVEKYESKKPTLALAYLVNTAVLVPTRKEYEELMRVYECAGYSWINGKLPTQRDVWPEYKEKTLIHHGILHELTYECLKNPPQYGCILSLNKFYQSLNVSSQKLSDIHNWFEKNQTK
ncbi:MAG: hypothetical protein ACOYT4_05105 [Nanoarchaeota archaeon]